MKDERSERRTKAMGDADTIRDLIDKVKYLKGKADIAFGNYSDALGALMKVVEQVIEDRFNEINNNGAEPETAVGNTVTVYHREGRRHETISVKINGIHLSGSYIAVHGFVHGSQSRYKIDMVGVPSPLFSEIHKSIFGYGAFGEMVYKDFTENASLTFDCTAVSIIEIGNHYMADDYPHDDTYTRLKQLGRDMEDAGAIQ